MSLTARMLRRSGLGLALVLLSACTDRSSRTLTESEPIPHFALGPKGTRTVTSLDDPGTGVCRAEYCTLRQAIEIAGPGDRIVFKANLTGRIVLTAGQLEIDEDVTIEGQGRITVDANSAGRVIEIADDRTVTLDGLSITGGQVGSPISPVNGGGIRTQSNVTLTVRNTTIAGNSANFGGGIVFSDGTLTLINSTIRENRASHQGGGLYNAAGLVSLVGSTVSENESGGQGGGLFNFGSVNFHGTMTVVNSTVSGNRSGSLGGGILNARDAVLTVQHSTITANHADGAPGIGTFGSVELTNTIVVGSSAGAGLGIDCVPFGFGFFTSGGHNLITPQCQASSFPPSDVFVSDPAEFSGILAGTLADNGGPTRTHALIEGGLAIDAGRCPDQSTDQRGLPRRYDHPDSPNAADACDIGAFEWQPPATKKPK